MKRKNKAVLIMMTLAILVGLNSTGLSQVVIDEKQMINVNITMQENVSGIKSLGNTPDLKDGYPLAVAWYAKQGIPILDHEQFIEALTTDLFNQDVSVITRLKGPVPRPDSWSYVSVARTYDNGESGYWMLNMPVGSYAMSHFAQRSEGIIVPFDYAYNRETTNDIETAYAYYYWLIRDNLKRWEPVLRAS